jgi:hypothetical protein
MKHQELRRMIDVTGELGWDDATRAAKFAKVQRETLARKALIQVIPFRRQPSAWERITAWSAEPTAEDGATVVDELAGVTYDVVLNAGRATYFAARAHSGALASVVELTRNDVAAIARDFLDQYREGEGEPIVTIDRDRALRLAKGQQRPRHEYVADVIRGAHEIGESPRAALLAKTGGKTATIDRWLREARAADPTLPQAARNSSKGKNAPTRAEQ